MKFNFDYIKHKNIIFAISLIIVVCGLVYGVVTGYKFDIDFKWQFKYILIYIF